jgi:hypothetical protein
MGVRTRALRDLLRLSGKDAFVILGVGVVMAGEVALIGLRQQPPPPAEGTGLQVLTDESRLFDGTFGPTVARMPRRLPTNTARASCRTLLSNQFFFARGTFREDPRPSEHRPMDEHMRAGFSATLRSLHEPSLSCAHRGAQVFRFLWERAFHEPLAIRVTLPSDQDFSAFVHLTSEPPRQLSIAEQREFVSAFERAAVWTMPTFKDAVGLDGASWVVEARVGSYYHVVDRWSPRPGPFRELGLTFMRLARVPTDEATNY